jgi:hypothetical protein
MERASAVPRQRSQSCPKLGVWRDPARKSPQTDDLCAKFLTLLEVMNADHPDLAGSLSTDIARSVVIQ